MASQGVAVVRWLELVDCQVCARCWCDVIDDSYVLHDIEIEQLWCEKSLRPIDIDGCQHCVRQAILGIVKEVLAAAITSAPCPLPVLQCCRRNPHLNCRSCLRRCRPVVAFKLCIVDFLLVVSIDDKRSVV